MVKIVETGINIKKQVSESEKQVTKLHEDLNKYGSVQEKDKPLIVAGILLALQQVRHGEFSIENLTGDTCETDGMKICEVIASSIEKADLPLNVNKNLLLNQFTVIKDNIKINEYNPILNKTPLKYYIEFIDNIFLTPSHTLPLQKTF